MAGTAGCDPELPNVRARRLSMTSDITSCRSSIEIGDPVVAAGESSKSPGYAI